MSTMSFNSLRKILLLIVSIVVCWSFLVIETQASTGTVTGSVLNIRDGPGTQYAKKGSLLKGASVTITESRGSWLKIKLNSGLAGWVHVDYIKTSTPSTSTPAVSSVSQGATGTVTGSVVNVREGPGTQYNKKGSVAKGQKVKINAASSSWVNITLGNGVVGWISAQYVKADPVAENPVNNEPTPASSNDSSSKIEVTGSIVNLREGPGTHYLTRGQVSKGDQLDLMEEQNGWYKVQTSRGISWLAGGLARVLTPPSAIAEEIQSPANPVPVEDPITPTGEIPLPGEINSNSETPSKLPGIARVMLDPGHGGQDPGAIGITGSYEKDVNLTIANKTAQLLRNSGVDVLMTRSDDRYITLNGRVDIANASDASIFVSIHSNSTTNRETNGTMVFYYVDQNIPAAVAQASEREQLARIIQNNLVRSLGRADKGVRQNNYVVIRYTEIPAILVETAYLSNLEEEMLLNDIAFQDRAAQAITNGIIEYFTSKGIL